MCLMFPLCPDLCKVLSMVNAHFSTPSQVTTHASREQQEARQRVVGASRRVNRQEVSLLQYPPPPPHAQNAAFCAPMSTLLTLSRALVTGKLANNIWFGGGLVNERTIHQFRTRLWGLTAVGSPPQSPSDEHLHRMMHVPLGECSTQGCPPCSTCPPHMCIRACQPLACRGPTRKRALWCCLEQALCACALLSLHS